MIRGTYQQRILPAIVFFGIVSLSNCARTEVVSNDKSKSVPNRDEVKLVIKSVDFYTWSGEGDKRKYEKLDKWEEIIKRNISNRASFDVVCKIEYLGDLAIKNGDYIALSALEFLVGREDEPPSDVRENANQNWSRLGNVDDIKLMIVPYIKSKETADITFKDFDINNEIKSFNEYDDILWIWAVKVKISILDRNMNPTAQGQQVLPLIPAANKRAR